MKKLFSLILLTCCTTTLVCMNNNNNFQLPQNTTGTKRKRSFEQTQRNKMRKLNDTFDLRQTKVYLKQILFAQKLFKEVLETQQAERNSISALIKDFQGLDMQNTNTKK